MRNIICVIGTRPEAIKMVPVVRALRDASWARCVVVVTAQHRALLDQMLDRFQVEVDHDLDLMVDNQSSSTLMSRMMPELDRIFADEEADAVLSQGDTTTVLAAALSAFHHGIPFGHVEAGLRTYDLSHPFPEEGYRQMVSRITHWHFAPTKRAATALCGEGIPTDRVFLTGNTCIDTLLQTETMLPPLTQSHRRLLLLTAHRRENFGAPLREIFKAILDVTHRLSDVEVIYPVHPNPNVQAQAHEILGGHPRISLIEPLDYFEFLNLMRASTLILTDSGGIQEEAPAFGKPVLVLRNTTERPEAVEAGVAMLVGTDRENIKKAILRLLGDEDLYAGMAHAVSPYGDGQAASRIVEILRQGFRPTTNPGS